MKLKTLLIVVAVLAGLSAIVYFTNRPEAPTSADARIGTPLLDPAVVEKTAQVTVTEAGNTVKLVKASEGAWQVESFHGLPADFTKLSRLIKDLTDAKIDSFVTSNPDRIARLEFKDTTIALADAQGAALWTLTLGKTADGGGRFIRFGDELKAYRTRLNAWLDTTARNWADSSLIGLKPADVATLEVTFADAPSLSLSRAKAGEPFVAANPPAGQQVRQSSVESLLGTLTGLRFSDTSPADSPEATAAREAQRRLTLTTFDGATVTVGLGRKAEQTIVKPAELKPETSGPAAIVGSITETTPPEQNGPAAITEATTETIPAGPVFAFIEGPKPAAKLADAPASLALKVADYVFTGLPKAPADLLEPVPAPAPAGDAPASETTPPASAPAP